MKKLITLFLILIATTAFANGLLEKDRNGYMVQAFAPDGTLSQTLTVNSIFVDMSDSVYWNLYAPTACKIRITPTAAKGAYPVFTAAANLNTGKAVNRKTPFVNFTGCTDGELQRH